MRFPRRFSLVRMLSIPALIFSVFAIFSYFNITEHLSTLWTSGGSPDSAPCGPVSATRGPNWSREISAAYVRSNGERNADNLRLTCPALLQSSATVDLNEKFSQLNFNPEWLQRREYWDSFLEERYKKRRTQWSRLPLKVIVLPHSHNDPGWLKTFEEYYSQSTQSILDNMVNKLTEHRNMTFIWTEIAYFSKWWQTAHPAKQRQVKQLVNEGRLEFTSGTWVMTDEATVHWPAMLDQMIEGHQWLKSRLGVTPTSVWSIDPFGHGPVAPYLLRLSGLHNTVVQRIHYAWKKYLADNQLIDFLWKQPWETESSILCHNFPFDIYSIKHSCGPDPETCLHYDFRSVPGEYTEYSIKSMPVTKANLIQKAEILLEQYGKQASLHPHNVALVLLGDDFRYNRADEWDQQYINYMNIFNYINNNYNTYHAEIKFGTLSDYFKVVRSRTETFPTLKGDFFPYSDIFNEGRPAYWTGYFTTRPYLKQLARELESALRSAEILYSLTLVQARQNGLNRVSRVLDSDYAKLAAARRSLALFQHHDGITGTSKARVMKDYGEKLFVALQDALKIQARCASLALGDADDALRSRRLLQYAQRQNYDQLPTKPVLDLKGPKSQTVVLFNSDPHFRQEVVRLNVNSSTIRVYDSTGRRIRHQLNPVWVPVTSGGYPATKTSYRPLADDFNLVFIADLPPLSLTTFRVVHTEESEPEKTIVYCTGCPDEDKLPFSFSGTKNGDVQIENRKRKLVFDGESGFLKSITTASGKNVDCYAEFGAYQSAMFHSGAYLFMPDPKSADPFIDVLKTMGRPQIYIISGSITSEISVVYNSLLILTTTIYHKKGSSLEDVVHIKLETDLGANPNYREHEFFFRLKTSIRNFNSDRFSNTTHHTAVFYTDQNGFQMQKRVRVSTLGVEANYYPVTTMGYIEDSKYRLSLLVSRAHGFSSLQPGWMEVMLDRRTIYDDGRGMGEGVTDNLRTVSEFYLVLEERDAVDNQLIPRASLLAHVTSSLLTNPSSVFVVDSEDSSTESAISSKMVMFLNQPLPCNAQLVNLRILSDPETADPELPSQSALMIIHNRGFDCSVQTDIPKCRVLDKANVPFHPGTKFIGPVVQSILETSLTGLYSFKQITLDEVRIAPMEVRAFNVTFV